MGMFSVRWDNTTLRRSISAFKARRMERSGLEPDAIPRRFNHLDSSLALTPILPAK